MARSGVYGGTETAQAMRKLAALVARPANGALRASLAPTLAAAQRGAPVDTGTLRRSLVIRRVRRSPKTKPSYVVGPDPKVRGPNGRRPVRYAHLVEFGLGPVKRARRFLTSAYEMTKEEVVKIFGAEFGPRLEENARRIAARVPKP